MVQQQTIPDVNLDADDIVADAIAAAKLDDFGPYGFRLAMEKLLWSLQHEARLTPLGRFIQRQRIVDILVNNLRMQDHLRRYPEIEQQQIDEPLFVVGLPRTGTTMLHRTIAADERMFAPLWYEVRNPSPWPQWDYRSKDPRITEAEAQVQAMLEGSPQLAAIHPMDALGPDEEIMLLEHSFHSTVPESAARVPAYAAWLETRDQTLAYEFLKKQLQFLQWQKRRSGQQGDRWALKSPHHLHFMDVLFKVFPDARVVQAHRDPVETIPSLASFVYSFSILASDQVDAAEVGRHWAQKFAKGISHTMVVRQGLPEQQFLDLWFDDTISQPLLEIEKIYEFAGMQLTPAAHRAMAEWQHHHRRELRPSHDYSLEQFGLSEQGLQSMFADYRERFIMGR